MGKNGKDIDAILGNKLKALFERLSVQTDVEKASAKMLDRLAEERQHPSTQSSYNPGWSLRWAGATIGMVVILVASIVLLDLEPSLKAKRQSENALQPISATDLLMVSPTAAPDTEHSASLHATAVPEVSESKPMEQLAQAELMEIAGCVLRDNGLPVSATVTYQSVQNESMSGTILSQDGTFQFKDLPKDRHTITAYSEDALADQATVERTASDVTLTLATKGTLAVDLRAGISAAGIVSDETMSRFTVSLQSGPGNPHLVAMESIVNGSGAAVFQDLPKGTYLVSARHNNIIDERFSTKTTIDTFYKQESLALSFPPTMVAAIQSLEQWQSLPADLAIAATYSCQYQHPPLGNLEAVHRYAYVKYQNPGGGYYGLCSDEEIKEWIETVSKPFQEQFNVAITWAPGSYSFEIQRGPENLPSMFSREYFGWDEKRLVTRFIFKHVDSFIVDYTRHENNIYHFPYYQPNFLAILAPLNFYPPDGFRISKIQQDQQSWHYSVSDESDENIVTVTDITAKSRESGQEISSIRFSVKLSNMVKDWVEAYFDRYISVGENIKLPQHILWIRQKTSKANSHVEGNLLDSWNPETDIRIELNWIDGQCGPLSSLFPDLTVLPRVPENCEFMDSRFRYRQDRKRPSDRSIDYRFTEP